MILSILFHFLFSANNPSRIHPGEIAQAALITTQIVCSGLTGGGVISPVPGHAIAIACTGGAVLFSVWKYFYGAHDRSLEIPWNKFCEILVNTFLAAVCVNSIYCLASADYNYSHIVNLSLSCGSKFFDKIHGILLANHRVNRQTHYTF